MSPPRSARSSLARATLLRMGPRIAVVIAVTTLLSYLHMLNALRQQSLLQLKQYVSERGQREQSLFLLAEDNHAVLKAALEKRLVASREEAPGARFDSLFARRPDGTVRSRMERFDGTSMACLFLPRGVPLDDELRRRILAGYDVLVRYGPAFHTRFTDTFITLPEGAHLSFWPEKSNYCLDAAPTESIPTQEFFPPTRPEHNPGRRTVWSGAYLEPVSKTWLTTVATPVDLDGRHVATIGHDVILNALIERTLEERLPGAYNMLVRDDGQLIAAPLRPDDDLLEQVKQSPAEPLVRELAGQDLYLAMARLRGPGWHFVTVQSASVVSRPAFVTARTILVLGVLSLILELGVLAWIVKGLTRPLLRLAEASHRVATGDFDVALDTTRPDELGQMASAFQHMAREVQRREEELRRANEGMARRGQELKEVHQQLVQAARRAGMAEVATQVLHNVGNVLTSVYSSAQTARERVKALRLEQLGRVADMLDAHQTDLAHFLTEDKHGQYLRPFVRTLGKSLMEERQNILSLLDELGRYTEHIGKIVHVQQDYARLPRLWESVRLCELVEDALRINAAGLDRHHVRVDRQLVALPPFLTDKHKVLMILTNLISNARYALDAATTEERYLHVRMERVAPESIRIEVSDNGMGIAPELLTRIFQYGFTTRAEGHGFGLHSCALAAREMGGSLTVQSDGPGRGATFTLQLPYQPAP